MYATDLWAQHAAGDDWSWWLALGALELASLQVETDLNGLDLGSTTKDEWVRMNLDTGAAVNVFPRSFSLEGRVGN